MADTRTEPRRESLDETSSLRGWLDYHRDTLRLKTAGLHDAQLAAALAPSTMTLGGLLKHLALVEDHWFSVVLHGNVDAEYWHDRGWDDDPDWEWHSAAEDSHEELRRLFDDAVAASDRYIDQALTGVDGLDTRSVAPDRNGSLFTLRWILMHLIEEYARHNGHADLLREAVDGTTGE